MRTILFVCIAAFGVITWSGCNPTTDDDFDPATPFAGAEDARGQWKWIPVDGMTTRTGAETGIGLRLQEEGATGLVIFMQGGGACFNDATCNVNPKEFASDDFLGWALLSGNAGIFNKSNASNPVSQWHHVFIPYVTGDLHFGQAPSADPANDEMNFVGYDNTQAVLDLLAPYFTDVDQVLLCGASAGGYGATFNYEEVRNAFPSIKVHLINDSGPMPAADSAFAPCLQEDMRADFNLDNTLPGACADCFSADGDGLSNLYAYYGQQYTTADDGSLGLISFKEDAVIRAFFGFGTDECVNLDGDFMSYSGEVYSDAITDLEENVLTPNRWSTFLLNGSGHVTITNGSYYSKSIQGISLAEWVTQLLAGQEVRLID